jgi:hypothetical protein
MSTAFDKTEEHVDLIRALCNEHFDEIAFITSELIPALEVVLAQHRAGDKRGMLHSVARASCFWKAILLHEKDIRELRRPLYGDSHALKKKAGE